MLSRQWVFVVTAIVFIAIVGSASVAGYQWSESQDLLSLVVVSALVLATFLFLSLRNRFSKQIEELFKEQTRLKRQLEEYHLVTEKQEFDANYAQNQVRKMKKEVQKKNTTLIQLASILSESMEEQLSLLDETSPDLNSVRQHSSMMIKFSEDLDTLAQLNFPTKDKLFPAERFDHMLQQEVERFQNDHVGAGKFFQIRSDEEQINIQKDPEFLQSLLKNLIETVSLISQPEVIEVNLITYIDAEIGDAVRIAISYKPIAVFSGDANEFFNEYQRLEDAKGQDISPGLAPVILRTLTGYLDGHISHTINSAEESTFVLVLPLGTNLPQEQ